MAMKNKPEILAPAGSYEALVAAVRSGADAVYLGTSAFNARMNAKNFTEEEDIQLVDSWLNVSMDPTRGANQTKNSFWKRIHDNYEENRNIPSDRTQGSLLNRWSYIQECVNKFCGCVARIENRRQSGMTITDKVI